MRQAPSGCLRKMSMPRSTRVSGSAPAALLVSVQITRATTRSPAGMISSISSVVAQLERRIGHRGLELPAEGGVAAIRGAPIGDDQIGREDVAQTLDLAGVEVVAPLREHRADLNGGIVLRAGRRGQGQEQGAGQRDRPGPCRPACLAAHSGSPCLATGHCVARATPHASLPAAAKPARLERPQPALEGRHVDHRAGVPCETA